MDNKYQNAKIYKVVDNGYNKCYYGSTIEALSMRMARHRRKYADYKNGIYHKFSIYDIFDEYGVENCKIELVEKYPCENKEELFKREGEYIKNNDCVNKHVAGRTSREYREDNKERISRRQKDFRVNNIELMKNRDKQKYERRKDKVLEQAKNYYENNKERIIEIRKQKIECPCCGSIITKSAKSKHDKSKKHQEASP